MQKKFKENKSESAFIASELLTNIRKSKKGNYKTMKDD